MTNANVLTNDGISIIMDRFANSSATRSIPTYLHWGIGDQTPTTSDIDLDYPIMKSPTTWDACDAVAGWANTGDADAETLNTTTGERKEGTGCLNLPATFAAGTAAWNKNVAAVNVTSKYVYVYLYISSTAYALLVNASDCVKVGLGTGGVVNIDYWHWAKTDLSSGWNLLVIKDTTSPDSDAGAGATITNIDYLFLSYQCTADITTNNIRMDYWHYGATTELDVSFASGYPIVNHDDQEITFRGRLGATEGNNHAITNVGIFNNDSTKLMVTNTQFDDVTKSSKVILVGQIKLQFS